METSSLHPKFGVIVEGVSLQEVTEDHLYPELRELFEEHSALLLKRQDLDEETHKRVARLFGPLENREAMASGEETDFQVPLVSNEKEGGVFDPQSLETLDLQANMLWHTDSTFLPVPALINILTAKVVVSEGGQTELASTRVGWEEMSEEMKTVFRDAIIWNRLSHSRARISPELAALGRMTRWPDRPWRAIWPNPVNGKESLYIASHSFAIEGRGHQEGQKLIDEAIEFCTRAENVYSHQWEVGDVLIWDERACLHRGQPWNYNEPRTLQSICCSVTEADGLASVKIV